MVWFNLHNNQVRASAHSGGMATASAMRSVSPKKELQMYNIRDRYTISYKADKFGDVEITYAPHLTAMMELGWPINQGPRNEIAHIDQLLYPQHELTDDPYHRIILSGLMARAGE